MLGGVSNMFGPKINHPLADAKELKRILGELPLDNAFKTLDEIDGWFESLLAARDFHEDQLFEVVRQLDEAAQPHVRRLARDYLHTPRLSKSEEKRLWSIVHGFWTLLAAAYERCLLRALQPKDRVTERLQPGLPLLGVRFVSAMGAVVKWNQFRYGPIESEIWKRLGTIYLAAESGKYADKALKNYPSSPGTTSIAREYLKILIFHASSMDSLLPQEIELAQRLIAHFLPGFQFTAKSDQESVYWVNPASEQPPTRLATMPASSPSLRFFHPGTAIEAAEAMLHEFERGAEVPPDLDLGGQYPARMLLPVLRHLTAYWNKVPPQRRHERHRVKHRMAVLNGLVNTFVAFSSEFGSRPAGLPVESWVVENVSRGGFGALVPDVRSDWLKVGALIALQPEGGENWLLAIVRRYHRRSESEAQVGVQAIGRQVVAVEVRVRTASSYAAVTGNPALWLQDDNEPGEARLVMPPASFDLRESLEFDFDGKRHLLTPVSLVEHTMDYDIARFRLLTAD